MSGIHFALWGLVFNPNTEDIREAPSLSIIEAQIKGTSVTAFDPEVMSNIKEQITDKINYAEDHYNALKGANALIIAMEWSEYRTPDIEGMEKDFEKKIFFD